MIEIDIGARGEMKMYNDGENTVKRKYGCRPALSAAPSPWGWPAPVPDQRTVRPTLFGVANNAAGPNDVIFYLRGFILVSAILAPITPARADGVTQAGSHLPLRAEGVRELHNFGAYHQIPIRDSYILPLHRLLL